MVINVIVAKIICLSILIFVTLLFSVIPYFLVLRGSRSLVGIRWRDKIISYLNCFAGGVFLGTLLLHLLTEGAEEFELYKNEAHLGTDFPIFNTFVAVGFFLVAFIELALHSCLQQNGIHSHTDENLIFPGAEQQVVAVANPQGQYGSLGSSVCPGHKDGILGPELEGGESLIRKSDCLNGGMAHGHGSRDDLVERSPFRARSAVQEVESHQHHDHGSSGALRAFLLLFALSFHTIFDGLAVGLQKNASEVWQVFMAITLHKSIIAFCLGLELFKSHLDIPMKAFMWLVLFSLMSPIGIGLGIILTSGGVNEMAKLLSSSILQGLAAGTFLYVTFLEILCVYIGHHCRGHFFHVFFAMVGFAFMAIVKLVDVL